MSREEKRFERVYMQSVGFGQDIVILVDRETSVQYLYTASVNGGGLTPLIGPDGSPLLYQRKPDGPEL